MREMATDPAFGLSESSTEEWARQKQRLVSRANGGQWNLVLAQVAAPLLGISVGEAMSHAAVRRAQELVGVESLADLYMEGSGLSAEEAEDLAAPIAPDDSGLAAAYAPRPPNFPAPYDDYFLSARHLGGHPKLAFGEGPLTLVFGANQVLAVPDAAGRPDASMAWGHVEELIAEGPNSVQERVTLPRVAAVGVFAWALKKKERVAYLTFRTVAGDVLFEVTGVTVFELRGLISPLNAWLADTGDVPQPPAA